jgi:hypothetical protein
VITEYKEKLTKLFSNFPQNQITSNRMLKLYCKELREYQFTNKCKTNIFQRFFSNWRGSEIRNNIIQCLSAYIGCTQKAVEKDNIYPIFDLNNLK